MAVKVFLDANVLIAGSASRTGASRAVLAMAEIGMIDVVVSRTVIDEAERNIRKKLSRILPIFTELLFHLNLTILDDPEPGSFQRWFPIIEEKDAPILEAAVRISADYLLSLNTKDFTPEAAKASGIDIQTPAAFVRNVREVLTSNL